MQEKINKFNLVDKNNDLKVFFFTVQKGNVLINIKEDPHIIMAYNKEDAFNEVRKMYFNDEKISITERSFLEVKKLVGVLNLPGKEKVVAKEKTNKKTEQDFIYGMMLIMDQFIKNKKDKVTVLKILNKIKCKTKN